MYCLLISILGGGCVCIIFSVILVLVEVSSFSEIVIQGGLISGGFLIIMGVYFLIKNNLLKRKMRIWMEDAVELYAYSEEISRFWMPMHPTATKIRVKFQWEGRNYVRTSGNGKRKAYQKVFTKYANRYIRILYSPKYDQIMILKDK